MPVLCTIYRIRCDDKHSLFDALPVPHVPVRVTVGALVAQRQPYGPPRCRTSQHCMTFIPLSVSLWNDLVDPVFVSVELEGFQITANVFYVPKRYHFVSYRFYFIFFLFICWYYEVGVFGQIGCESLSPSLALQIIFNYNYNNMSGTTLLSMTEQSIGNLRLRNPYLHYFLSLGCWRTVDPCAHFCAVIIKATSHNSRLFLNFPIMYFVMTRRFAV